MHHKALRQLLCVFHGRKRRQRCVGACLPGPLPVGGDAASPGGNLLAGLNLVSLDGSGRWVPYSDCYINWSDQGGWARALPRNYTFPIFCNPWPRPLSITAVNIQTWTWSAIANVPGGELGFDKY